MDGYYLIGVYGSYGDNTKFKIRVSTKTEKVDLLREGIPKHVSLASTPLHYLFKNPEGVTSFTIHVTPSVGDAEIWMNVKNTSLISQAYTDFPTTRESATYHSTSRNTLRVEGLECEGCYYQIVIVPTLKSDLDIVVKVEELSLTYLPFNQMSKGNCDADRVDTWYVTVDGITHPDNLEARFVSITGRGEILVDIGTTELGT